MTWLAALASPRFFTTSSVAPSDASRRFGVLVAGHASEYTQRKYGGYGTMLAELLKDPGEIWDVFYVVEGKFPPPDSLANYQGFVVSGSRHDAHGDEQWIKQLCCTIQALHEQRKKILGVCFGHQVLCRGLGGITGRAPVGWEVGMRDVVLNKNMFSKYYGRGLPERLKVLQSHRDQVLELPPGGVLLGSSIRTPVEVFGLNDHILGIQGHPEFTKDVLMDIIRTRVSAETLSEAEAAEAEASLQGQDADEDALVRLCKAFLKPSDKSSLE